MKVITAPTARIPMSDMFLGGGISNCPDWQAEVISALADTDIFLLNPRRNGYLETDGTAAKQQVEWEYKALRSATSVMFWFPEETLCPITLYELGVFSEKRNVRLFVGTHPNYARRFDVVTQMGLTRPRLLVHDSLPDLISEVREVDLPNNRWWEKD